MLKTAVRLFAGIFAVVSSSLAAIAADMPVDLELVLAVDVSRSMDTDEQKLQRDGYIAAFRHQDVIDAISSGPSGRIAVSYVEWAGPAYQTTLVPWTVIDGEAAGLGLRESTKLITDGHARFIPHYVDTPRTP